MRARTAFLVVMGLIASMGALGCGNDADRERIGGECAQTTECENEELTCLTAFKGGYCGKSGCEANEDCPEGSICVTQGATNYCFRTCTDKAECNQFRTVDNESNCSSNITRVDPAGGNAKACVPPSGS